MDEDFDFDALNNELERSMRHQGAYDIMEQAEALLRQGVVPAIQTLNRLVLHSDSEMIRMKCAMFIVDRVVGTKPVEADTTKALVEKLTSRN